MNTKAKAPPPAGAGSADSAAEPAAWYLQKARSSDVDEASAKALRVEARNKFKAQFGMRCKQARGRMEVTDAAKLLGVHRNTLSNIERGETLPDAFELEVIAQAYKTTVGWLLTGKVAAPVSPADHAQLLRDVISAVLGALEDQQLELSNQKVGQLIDLIYEHELSQPDAPTENGVQRTAKRFLRLVAA